MSNKEIKTKEMVVKSKNKVLSCSTPDNRLDSPSRDSDSIYDSDASSPVPFLCTQDGAEGETDVVWNFYTPKSGATKSKFRNTTPVSRRIKKSERPKHIDKPAPKRRTVKPSQKKIELFQELVELNHNVHKLVDKSTAKPVEKPQSEEDIFSDCSDSSPRSGLKIKNPCLRKNVLSSKFIKTESESGLESDDSMNEYLLKASQVVEENILKCEPIQAKRPRLDPVNKKNLKPCLQVNIDQDSMDAILSNIQLDSPSMIKVKKCESPLVNNDSFDNLVGNLNDSALEMLSQIPIKNEPTTNTTSAKTDTNWSSPSSKTIFGRHNSMPESPSVNDTNKPSTSGMVFGRYSSMPFNKSIEKIVPGDSPIRCTPEEIKKKHQQARERLLAKRVLPFTPSHSQSLNPSQTSQHKFVPKKPIFQPKVPTVKTSLDTKQNAQINTHQKQPSTDNIKLLIEKKRQEALMKLRRRQAQNKF
ncbi:uncharacterized protein LOC126775976 [Nymphalis io]|uniref:uncharacterized protein LOC126775976 n=1 Tax=Inachis io TaxID=171585 RepID=UPI0021688E52|nr:uncharacterized protein LOC126775976 [Nymphalis io]